ncbi:response regulator transcription factor [bacterium]|nr:response regulator transcription factor [bacterium]
MSKRIVLLVDDHAAVRSGLRMLLESGGFTVLEAADSAQTFHQLEQQRVDLVLLDSQLENEDGIDLAAALRRQHRELPLAILTMHSDLVQVRRAVAAGANGYLLKQSEGEELLAASRVLVFGGFYLDSRLAEAFLSSPEGPKIRQDSASQRKRLLLEFLRENLSNQQMAERLKLSVSSVKACLRELYEEHQVRDRTGLLLATMQNESQNPEPDPARNHPNLS